MPRDTLVDFFADLSVIEGDFVVYDNGYRPQTFRYREVAAMARAVTLRLRATGIRKGDKVLIWSENRPGWIGALWGCILDGIILVPLDYRVSAEFLLSVSQLVAAKALLIGDQVSAPSDFASPVWRLTEIEKQSAPTVDRVTEVAPDDTVQIVFTSGATADPKGVVITHRNLLANMVPVEREINRYKKYGRPFFPLRFLNLLPLSHLFGQAMATYMPPMLAGVVIFMAGYEPAEIIRQIHSRRVSVLVCVPKMLEVLRGYVTSHYPETSHPAKPGPWWVAWWRYRRVHRALGFKFWAFVVGAAPLDAELEQFWSRLGFLVIQGYGLTETAPIVTLNHPFHAQKGTVGKPIAGVEVKIAPDGEILVRGPNVSSGYYQSAGAASQVQDGRLHTGDLGELAADGNLIVHGRKKDVIVTPEGLNAYPEDIERVLAKIPGVKEAAVVGPDRVHAVLVLEPGTNPEEVANLANRQLEEYQRIRTVHVWPGDTLPRTEGTGKLKRVPIREWLTAGTPQTATPAKAESVLDLLRRLAPGRDITPETTLEDLGLSSLERIELMNGIEQKLGGSRDETAFAGARHVSDLLNIPPASQPATGDYPRWSRSLPARALRRILLPAVVFPLTRYYARIEVHGLEHLAHLPGEVILASNHQSYMDGPAIMAALPVPLRYRLAPAMSKEFFAAHFHPSGHSLYERFVRGLQYYLAVLCFNAFPLPQRESGVGGALRYAGELSAAGWSILIFPEGQMTDRGDILPFQPGVALLSSRLSLPIVPVRIRGLDKVLHRTAHWATPGPVHIAFGAPIPPPAGDWHDLAGQVQEAVKGL